MFPTAIAHSHSVWDDGVWLRQSDEVLPVFHPAPPPDGLEQLLRYDARPPVAIDRLTRREDGTYA